MNTVKRSLLCAALITMACVRWIPAHAFEATKIPIPQIFRDAKPMLGQELKVTGLLRWAGENRNLFPAGTDPNNPPEPLCLPILIKRSDTALIRRAQELDAATVVIEGRIVDPAPPGEVTLGSCKPIGIEVRTIDPVGR
ncbi:hypothetical protein [Dyella sp. 2YAF14]|jgi:hypothetical protein|uniref:hypothetical protein n=1 Tax=Dyella sp. 2YAF14 TaxID=3233025 RepID=UPI003F908BDA